MPIWYWRNKQTWNTETQEEAGTESKYGFYLFIYRWKEFIWFLPLLRRELMCLKQSTMKGKKHEAGLVSGEKVAVITSIFSKNPIGGFLRLRMMGKKKK